MRVNTAAPTSGSAVRMRQTEIGALPADWSVVPLISLAEKIMVGIASAATHAYRNTGVVLFRNQNIRPGLLDTDDVLYIDPEYEAAYKNKRLRAGDLLTARTGYPGTTSLVPDGFDGSQSFTTLITRPNPRAVDARYLCLYINGRSGQRYFEQAQIGGGQKNVNAAALKLMPIAMPSTETEQQAIADTLTDAGALIDSLEQLLTKKRQIKQGAMQELLTGKRRLPEFSGRWTTVALHEVVEVRKGELITAASAIPGDFPVIGGGKSSLYTHNSPNRPGPVITVSASGANAGYVSFHDGPIFASDCSTVEEGAGYSVRFIYYALVQRQQTIFQAQTGGAQPHVQPRDLALIVIDIPTDPAEQTAIAHVLSDMDTDITALESRLTKARALKQAMAQALLTGRIRLVEGAAA